MKHFLLPCCALLGFVLGATVLPPFPNLAPTAAEQPLARRAPRPEAELVYVCLGAHAGRYHCSRSCVWLTHCGHPVQALEATQAKHRGQWACQQCLIRLV